MIALTLTLSRRERVGVRVNKRSLGTWLKCKNFKSTARMASPRSRAWGEKHGFRLHPNVTLGLWRGKNTASEGPPFRPHCEPVEVA